MSSESVFLTSPSGAVQFSVSVLCDGEPCAFASSRRDPGTGKQAARLLAPRAGDLRLLLSNVALEPACVFRLHRAELRPGEAWQPHHLEHRVNHINCLRAGQSYELRRDETTGCAVRVEPLLDTSGRPVRDPEVVAQNVAVTKWLLHVFPADVPENPTGRVVLLQDSVWRACEDSGERDGARCAVCVRTPQGPPVLLAVTPGDNVAAVKRMLGVRPGLPAVEFQQLNAADGSPLSDEDTAASPGGPGAAVVVTHLYLCDRRAPLQGPRVWVFVKTPAHGTLVVDCVPSDKIKDVLRKLLSQHGLDEYQDGEFALFKESDQEETILLNENASLGDAGVSGQSVLALKEYLPSTLRFESPHGSLSVLRVRPSDRIAKVKRRIAKKLGKTLFDPEYTVLFYGERELSDGKTLESECIPELATLTVRDLEAGSALRFQRRRGPSPVGPFTLYVRQLAGRIVTLRCEPCFTVERLKILIQGKEGIPVDEQRIVFKGKQLEDGRTLQECNIMEEDTLHLVMRLAGGGGAEDPCGAAGEGLVAGAAGLEAPELGGSAAADSAVVGKVVAGRPLPKPPSSTCYYSALTERGNFDLQLEVYVDPAGVLLADKH